MKSIVLPTGTEYVLFGELAHLIAGALYPLGDDATDSEMMAHGGARINLEAELNQAVKAGTLPVKDPLTFGPHSYPVGESLRRSLVKVDDLRAYLAGRPVTIEIAPAPDETAPVITFASFGKSAFMQLIRHEEKRLMAHEVRADGVYVRAPDASDMRMGLIEPPAIHPTGDYDAPALPFPFTLAEFLAFEKTAGIVGQMHDDEIAALKDKTPMPYQLARAARYVEAGGNVNDLMQTPEPQAAPVGAESAAGDEAVQAPDPERRLSRLRALGGMARYRSGEWKFTGIAVLVAAEKNEGRKRCDEKTIRADLKEAAEAERDAKRAGPFQGLGG